jgi:hypothetical protein
VLQVLHGSLKQKVSWQVLQVLAGGEAAGPRTGGTSEVLQVLELLELLELLEVAPR